MNSPLSLGQPYIQKYANIVLKSGELHSEIELQLPAGESFTLGGSIEIPGLEIIDRLENQRLLGWGKLDIDHFDLIADGLHLSQMIFEQAFGRFVIFDDQSTNLSVLFIEQATDSNAPANIRLEGQVDDYGLARIDGSMNILDPIRHTDVTVEFRNLHMTNLSPYTVQFAGRAIDEGTLDPRLVYAINEGQMHGSNDVVLSDLMLGDMDDQAMYVKCRDPCCGRSIV